MHSVLAAYNLIGQGVKLTPFGSGLINHTWKVEDMGKEYILQRINNEVFKQPGDIENNIKKIGTHLQENCREYNFAAPVKTLSGHEMMYSEEEGYFRMFPFIALSHSIDVVETAEQAYEAATQFGRFTKLLSGINLDELKITIPDFHNLSLRYQQFLLALKNGNISRLKQCKTIIAEIKDFEGIVQEFEQIKNNPAFKLRVTHHDTKISNVLFDDDNKGLCVIDLDTVMPGYFISDVGDMMRTYLSPVSEEEKDFSKIEIRDSFYTAIVKGYYNEMKDELSETEKQYFFYAGKFMIYMQALRFITDYLNDDVYYGVKYPEHNLVRGQNQLLLLQKLVEKENILHAKIILEHC